MKVSEIIEVLSSIDPDQDLVFIHLMPVDVEQEFRKTKKMDITITLNNKIARVLDNPTSLKHLDDQIIVGPFEEVVKH